MKKNLIIYSTTDGHTKKICNYISEKLEENFRSKTISLDKSENIDLTKYDLIIVGASIRYGKHKPELYSFIHKNLEQLNSIDSAFFSVNAVARKDNKGSIDTNPYMLKFLKNTNWEPKSLAVFAGKIDYSKYKVLDKFMIRFIMWLTGGPTNILNVHEFTDWNRVELFCKVLINK